jgi:ABC-type spermidine/putrescine transport system permease subunit II
MNTENYKQFISFLTLGFAEDLCDVTQNGTDEWKQLSRSIKTARNISYSGLFVATIASLGLLFSSFKTVPIIIFTAVIVISLVVTAIALKILFEKTNDYLKK